MMPPSSSPPLPPDDLSRRQFLARTGAGVAGLLLGPGVLLESCSPADSATRHIRGGLRGPDHAVGHLLRTPGRLPAPSQELSTDILIVGGGVAGLAARRELARQGHAPLLLELEARPGGNSASGQSAVSAYPWGAHYLPVPDERNHELLAFLRESGVITGFDAASGLPVYNEYHLCHDPEERLLLHGHWQQGLVPEVGVPAADREQMARFFKLVDGLKHARGTDGRDAFAIPLDQSSADPQFRRLDQLTFAAYLDQHGFTSPYLRWYLDYGCRDDYGATAAQVSAWAGLHYFAARKGRAHNATASDVLTWPEGNGFLAEQLRGQGTGTILSHTVACQLRETPQGVEVLAYDATARRTMRIRARQVLLAIPQFVAQHLLSGVAGAPVAAQPLQHAPWLVANLTVTELPQGQGQPLCWDNVGYGGASVGYVNANHQQLAQYADGPKVITLYWPLTDAPPAQARREAYQTTYSEWLPRILAELEYLHPGATPFVQRVEAWVWGHGMVAPTPGYLWGPERAALSRPVRQRIFFAHSDYSGMSIFEEAFYQGLRAAHAMVVPV
ncbi:NAD(P)-binding protein [Hymenobacter psychrotolerans]|uniref:Tat (Twin-arginine translocation) pathway signal sequence n=1 Tax=Hymenobacter psychrotolerans DSM 18569 TaxID=1121959 RepID=A0A1M7GKZ0_9BACT|nr:NAD(P)/FAD-dependent oxidoreductase [Hymenobacter psychrotolerans]SHM16577.1 Tat (twin-arginine translocation) pathway signal sequence [Hymenobacter psychrotolerans DSM 18569]